MVRTERQAHGFIFQSWVIKKFLDMAYTAKWDIPSAVNPKGSNISIKTAAWGASVGLGDALKQFKIDENFEMLVAFYEQKGKRKVIVNMQLIPINVQAWKGMWGKLTETQIKKLDSLVKSQAGRKLNGTALNNFRNQVNSQKKSITAGCNSIISLNPKIDSKNQRRLQCSMPFDVMFAHFNLTKAKMTEYVLWGEKIKLNMIRLE